MPPKTTIPQSKSWYRFQAKAAAQAELLIYDEIGLWGITAKDFYADLKALGELTQLDVRINSPGGDVFDGLAIFNILNRHPATVIVTIDGIAASIASVVAMAGDEIVMPANTFYLIHDPSGAVLGTADDMRELAEALDKVKHGLLSAYRAKTGLPDDQLTAMMSQETWLNAEEALELGFADRIIDPVKLAAHFDLRRFAHPPEQLQPQGDHPMSEKIQSLRNQQQTQEPGPADPPEPVEGPEQPPADPPEHPEARPEPGRRAAPAEDPAAVRARAAEIVRLCAEAGAPKFAIQAIAQNMSVAAVIARLSSAAEIRNLCATARLADLAAGFIESGLTTEQVRARLFDQLVAAQGTPITSHILPAASQTKPIDSAKIYAARRTKNSY